MKKIILGLLTINLFVMMSFVKAKEIQLEEITDFHAMSKEMQQDNLVLVLEFHAKHCTFCKQLEENVLIPMLYNGDYNDQIRIRQLALDSHDNIIGFSGETTTGAKLAEQMKVIVTPTLVFLDAEGKEVSERIVGINTPDLFDAYVDAAIAEGHQTLVDRQSSQTANQVTNDEVVASE